MPSQVHFLVYRQLGDFSPRRCAVGGSFFYLINFKVYLAGKKISNNNRGTKILCCEYNTKIMYNS